MAKRFTDTEKWKKKFRRGLPGAYKLLWDYVLDACNHAGIWEVDMETAQLQVGSDMPVTEAEALGLFGDRILVLDGGNKWCVVDFIFFQYGGLNSKNNTHKSVVAQLNRYGLVYEGSRVGQGLGKGSTDINVISDNSGFAGDAATLAQPLGKGWARGMDTDMDKEEDFNSNNKKSIVNTIPLGQGLPNPCPTLAQPLPNPSIEMPWPDDDFRVKWGEWIEYMWKKHNSRYVDISERLALESLWKDAGGKKDVAIGMINESISSGWKKFYNHSNSSVNGNNGTKKRAAIADGNIIDGGASFWKK